MNVSYRPFKEVNLFAPTDVAYAECQEDLMKFAKYQPKLESFGQAIEDKKKDDVDRQLLVRVLREQYSTFHSPSDKVTSVIESLSDPNTFTVTTAHQPVLFTGPLYVIYKIISAIKLSHVLKNTYSDYKFVPVFVTGGEDHDFEEMDHTLLFGNLIRWENDEFGPVGRMSTSTLKEPLQELKQLLGSSDEAQKTYDLFEKTLLGHEHYGPAFADLINGLFGDMGLVVLNMDHPALKTRMTKIFKDELFDHHSSQLVRATQQDLESCGYKPQAYVRDINLFFLEQGSRERIEKDNEVFKVLNSDHCFTKEEMLDLVENHPEKLSPNVVTRPLYQELILPNLAYIGGGGELAYWLERKTQFEHFGINFPILIRRDSCLWVDPALQKRIDKLNLPIDDFFKDEDLQVKDYVTKASENEFKLGEEKGQISQIFKSIEEKAKSIDPTLRSTIAAESRNQIKALERIEDKLRKAEKQRHEIELGQISKVREKLFPGGGLQERKVNFLEFYTRHPESYFQTLYDAFDPLNTQLKILS